MILDILKDVNKYMHGIGILPAVRIKQTKDGIMLQSIGPDQVLIVHSKSALKFSDDELVFGLGQLGLLQSILDCPEYAENAKITLGRDDNKTLSKIDFANSTGDFTNSYRLMNKQYLDVLMPELQYLGNKWKIELTPNLNSIKRFNLQTNANPDETTFVMKLVKDNLEVSFGNPGNHSGRFVFAENVKGSMRGECIFPISVFQKILNLSAHAQTAHVKLTDEGLMCVSLNSGLVEYDYLIPALSK